MENPNPTRRTTTRRLYTSPSTSFASSTSTFSSSTSFFKTRPASPTPINLYGSSSVRYRSISPNLPISVTPTTNNHNHNQPAKRQLPTSKRVCLCSPTSHPGSFRCSLHKNVEPHHNTASYPSTRLNARRSAMTNSLVRVGTVEGGDLVKRALSALIRPSSHQQRRRTAFKVKPSRLSVMSRAEDL